jgi:hypothetical protein
MSLIKAAVFTENNCRVVHKTEEELKRLEAVYVVVRNPDFTQVSGFAPHLWTVDRGMIVPLTGRERAKRDEDVQKNGPVNEIVVPEVEHKKRDYLPLIMALGVAGAALALAAHLLHLI